jgi:hypothetical protein
MTSSTVACQPCTEWVTASGIFPTQSEWCNEVGASNPAWLSLDVDCCPIVPTLEHTWGRVKTFYR